MKRPLLIAISSLACVLACKTPLMNTQVGSASQPAVQVNAPPITINMPPGLVNFQPGSIAPVLNAPVSQDFNIGRFGYAIAAAAIVITCLFFWFKTPPWKAKAL